MFRNFICIFLIVFHDMSTSETAFNLLTSSRSGAADDVINDDVISCLEAKVQCLRDAACRIKLESLDTACDSNVYSCSAERRQSCREVLTSIQTSRYFGPCTCDPSTIDAHDCIHLQKTIFFHACVLQDGSHANVTWLSTGVRSGSSGLRRDVSDDDLDNEDDENVDESMAVPRARAVSTKPSTSGGAAVGGRVEEESCIGIRRRCLLDERCERHLANYRNYCRENKKQNECVATDRQMCYDSLTALQRIRPELFNCACPMKKPDTKDRCDRIQWRLANNTCLVTVPYVIHSIAKPGLSYERLRQMTSHVDEDTPPGSCIRGFSSCHDDAECRPRLMATLAACKAGDDVTGRQGVTTHVADDDDDDSGELWRSRCDRDACLRAINTFYSGAVSDSSSSARWRQSAERLLLCTCDDHRPDDRDRCETVRAGLTPGCASVDLPPPTCLDLVRRCTDDSDCGDRWKAFERHCTEVTSRGDVTRRCPTGSSPQMCREAMVRLAGTELTTNCTCAVSDPGQYRLCIDLRRRIQQSNACKAAAVDEYISSLNTMTSTVASRQQYRQSTTLSGYSSDDAYHQNYDDSQQHPDCLRHYSQKIPSFMTMPNYIRIYRNESSCSDICSCTKGERKIVCRALPCGVNMSCKQRDVVYVHGASFSLEKRGHCRCINGEIICAKPPTPTTPQQAGLFLHVGYSTVDQQLVEAYSPIRLSPESVASKLGTLLNEDSAAQFCTVVVYNVVDGNLVFNVNASKYNTRLSGDVSEDCVQPAKTLGYMINSRHSAVISDVELSVLKVSLLERVQMRDPSSLPASTIAATPLPPWSTDRAVGRLLPITVVPSSAASRERKGAQLNSAAATSSANSSAVWRMKLSHSSWDGVLAALLTTLMRRYSALLYSAAGLRPSVV